MTQRAKIILQEALALPEEERAKIADALLESLATVPEADVEEAWRQEVAARVAAADAGEVETISWEDVRNRLLARAITPEVEKISGLVPTEVNAKAEYREHILKKHQ